LLFDLTKVVHDLEHFLVSGRASKIVNLFDLVALGIDILRDKHLEQTSKGIQYFLLAELAVFVRVNLVHLVYEHTPEVFIVKRVLDVIEEHIACNLLCLFIQLPKVVVKYLLGSFARFLVVVVEEPLERAFVERLVDDCHDLAL
jgi:hypothetical protein